jgi:uncharacterized RDD family membrane protein YckC
MDTNLPKHSYGGFWRRLVAYTIDVVPFVVLLFLIAYFFLDFGEVWRARATSLDARTEFLRQRNYIRDGAFLLWVIYCIFMEASSLQGTLGKYVMGLKVVDESGNALSLKRSAIRNASKILSYLPISLGFAWAVFNKRRRTWHDFIAKTLVVKRESDVVGQ